MSRKIYLLCFFAAFSISKIDAQVFSKYGPTIPPIQFFIEAQNGGYYGLSDIQNGIILIRFDE
jgi:hypothetical protein